MQNYKQGISMPSHLRHICFRFHKRRGVYIWTSNITTIYLKTSSGSVYAQRVGFSGHKAAWQNETHTSTAGRRGNWIRDRASLMWRSIIEFGMSFTAPYCDGVRLEHRVTRTLSVSPRQISTLCWGQRFLDLCTNHIRLSGARMGDRNVFLMLLLS